MASLKSHLKLKNFKTQFLFLDQNNKMWKQLMTENHFTLTLVKIT